VSIEIPGFYLSMIFTHIKSKLENKTGLVRGKYSLKFNGKVLEIDRFLLSSFGLKEGSEIEVVLVDEGKEDVLE
jgi:hypothetical protein